MVKIWYECHTGSWNCRIYIVHLKLEIRNNTLTRVLHTVVQTASLISLILKFMKMEYFLFHFLNKI